MSNSDGEETLGERLAKARAASVSAAFSARGPELVEDESGGEEQPALQKRTKAGTALKRRGRKDEPREVSSRRPVPFGRSRCLGIENDDAASSKRKRSMDPRFEDHCGNLKDQHVKRNYEFLKDVRGRELAEARKSLEKDPKNFALRSHIRKMEAQDARVKSDERRAAIRAELIAEEKEKVKMGKKPYFFKESVVRERELKEKFEELKARGGVQKYIEKRRKRAASKDRRHLLRRRGEDEDI